MKIKLPTYRFTPLVLLCRLLLAATFIFSGFVKVADPMGMVHKLHAYVAVWGVHCSTQSILLKVYAAGLGTLEFVLGVYLFLGIRRRFTRWVTLLFMSVFILLTIWIYSANPVSDCGCFGDAVTLTNGESLVKNIVLWLASLVLFLPVSREFRFITERTSWLISVYAWVYAIALALYTLHYLPVLDFTPYARGADIRAALNGEADSEKALRLANFYVADPHSGDDKTLDILADTGYTFILAVPYTAEADDGCCNRINDLYDYCRDKKYHFYMATASGDKDITDWIDRTGAAYPVLLAEDTELNAMVRANPGLLLLKNGKLIEKWSNNNLPDTENAVAPVESFLSVSDVHPLTKLVLWFLVPLLVVLLADNAYRHWYNRRVNRENKQE